MTQRRNDWLILAVVLAAIAGLVVILVTGPAWPADKGEWFRSLRQPGTGASCCSISDCVVVENAEFLDGHWWAIRPNGEDFEEIPDDVVLWDHDPLDDGAVMCIIRGEIVCFVPKLMGF